MVGKAGLDLLQLLQSPWGLFSELYQFTDRDFLTLSNKIRTDLESLRTFEALSRELFNCLVKTDYPNPGKLDIVRSKLQDEIQEFSSDDEFSILCLALFKALGEYLGTSKRYELKHSGPIKIGYLTITTPPPNVIYENLPNPIRRRYGVGIHDFTDLFEHISVIKETSPVIELLKKTDLLSQTDTYLGWRIREGFKIGISPFFSKIELETQSLVESWPRNKKTPYWFTRIRNKKEAEDHLHHLLRSCQKEGVNILILPELMIDQRLLKSLKAWLEKNNRQKVSSGHNGLIMVVAGSFHVEEKEGAIYNISTILNHRGNVLWSQKKRQPYSFDRKDIESYPEFKILLNTSDEGGDEKISTTEIIYCLDTALGRICVCICLDYFHHDHAEALKESGINVFFVPAMSPQNIQLQQKAWQLGSSNQAASFVALSGIFLKAGTSAAKEKVSFYYLPRTKEHYAYAIDNHSDLLIFDIAST